MSAATLYQLAQALDVPIGYFFEELELQTPNLSPDDLRAHASRQMKVQA